MKKIKTFTVAAALGLVVCGLAFAQGLHGGAPAHLPVFFAKIASFDTNKDGQLDAAEKEAVATAISDIYGRLAAYDANHDGALDAVEVAAIKSAIEKGELVCPHGFHDAAASRR